MKKVLAIIGLSLMGFSYGMDEYGSIEKGKLEVDVGYWYTSPTGRYNADGKKLDNPSSQSPMINLLPLQLKYGIMPGLDVELASVGTLGNKDAGEPGGFTQPQLGVKYTHAPLGLGGYLNMVMPFVTGNLDQPFEPAMGIGLGAVYGNRFGDFRLTGQLGYQVNMENKDKYKSGNVLSIYAKPEAMWTEFIGTYLGIMYSMTGESAVNGTSLTKSDGNLFMLMPGANVALLPWLAYEVNAPITISGTNERASWGIGAKVYVTLPK